MTKLIVCFLPSRRESLTWILMSNHLLNNYHFSLLKNFCLCSSCLSLFVLVCVLMLKYICLSFFFLERKFSLCNFEGLISLFLGFRYQHQEVQWHSDFCFSVCTQFSVLGVQFDILFLFPVLWNSTILWLWNHCTYYARLLMEPLWSETQDSQFCEIFLCWF